MSRGSLSSAAAVAGVDKVTLGTARVLMLAGSGTPEGAVTAPVGSIYLRSDGASETTAYTKQAGSGNTGWVAQADVVAPGAASGVSADNAAVRSESVLHWYDTDDDVIRSCVLEINAIQRTNPTAGTIARTGIHIKQYSQPDNGGDTSGLLINQTGGGNGASIYHFDSMRPSGYTSYIDDGYALEVGHDGGNYAMLLLPGMRSSARAGGGLLVSIQNAGGKGILVGSSGNTLDARIAFATGAPITNGADQNPAGGELPFRVKLNGDTKTTGLTTGTVKLPAGTYSLAATNHVLLCNASAGAITLNLPAAAIGRQYVAKKIDDSVNTVTIDPAGSALIDGASTKVLSSEHETARMVCDGTDWFLI